MRLFDRAWSNAGTRLWLAGEQPEYLGWCQVEDIKWRTDMRRVCPYCGSFTNGKCPNCGGVGEERISYVAEHTEVLVTGILPQSSVLFFLPAGCGLEILHKSCGDPSVYYQEDVILRFLQCQIVERRMVNVTTMESSNEDWLRIGVWLECVAQLILEADDPWKETVDRWLTTS